MVSPELLGPELLQERPGRAAAFPGRRRGGLNTRSSVWCLVSALPLRAEELEERSPAVIERLLAR